MADNKEASSGKRRLIYTGAITGTPAFVSSAWNMIKNVEAGMSFWEQIISLNMMIYLDIFIPLVIGGIAFSLVYIGFKIKDWFQSYVNKLEKAEEDLKDLKEKQAERISDNESSIKRIENNLLIQESINRQNADFIAKSQGKSIEELEIIYENKHKEFIEDRGNNIKRGQEGAVLQQYRSSLDQFHNPAKI